MNCITKSNLYGFIKEFLLIISIFIFLLITWFFLAILGSSYEDGIDSDISKWSYYSIKYGVLFSYNIFDYWGFENPIIPALLTSTILLYMMIKFIFLKKNRGKYNTNSNENRK